VLTIAAYDIHLEQLLERVSRLHEIFSSAGVPYRIVGGVAVFAHVAERDPLNARLTRDVDAAIARADLPRVIEAARQAGWDYRRAAGVDMLVEAAPGPSPRSAVHLVFTGEKIRAEYAEPVPSSPPDRTPSGVCIATVADLVRMKLTSYRLKDRVHIQDLDAVGLVTPEIEAGLPDLLRARLAEVRATE
jgi:hypothetical protein